MSIRIYALARDLKVGVKALIDLCRQLGINDNANALTNLTDAQVATIKAHLGQIPSASAIPHKETAPQKKSVFIKTADNGQSGCQNGQNNNRRRGGVTIRLYSLAKELKVESKALVDICQLLGINTKASALTNLTEDEVAKIKAHLARQSH